MASLSTVHAVSVNNLGSRILENGASSASFRALTIPNTLRGGTRLFSQRLNRRRVAVCSASPVTDISKVIPQADRVLVKLQEVATKTAGGVLLPSMAAKFERILLGEVVAVGKEAQGVVKGDKILVADVNAWEVNLGKIDARLVFCKSADLLAVVETS